MEGCDEIIAGRCEMIIAIIVFGIGWYGIGLLAMSMMHDNFKESYPRTYGIKNRWDISFYFLAMGGPFVWVGVAAYT